MRDGELSYVLQLIYTHVQIYFCVFNFKIVSQQVVKVATVLHFFQNLAAVIL